MPSVSSRPVVAVGDSVGTVHLIDVNTGLLSTLALHKSYVTSIAYLPALAALLSLDAKVPNRTNKRCLCFFLSFFSQPQGMMECWSPCADLKSSALPAGAAFKTKSETDMYELARKKTFALSVAVCADKIAVFCADNHVRVFKVPSNKEENPRKNKKMGEKTDNMKTNNKAKTLKLSCEFDEVRSVIVLFSCFLVCVFARIPLCSTLPPRFPTTRWTRAAAWRCTNSSSREKETEREKTVVGVFDVLLAKGT